jgi:hypothetical protein
VGSGFLTRATNLSMVAEESGRITSSMTTPHSGESGGLSLSSLSTSQSTESSSDRTTQTTNGNVLGHSICDDSGQPKDDVPVVAEPVVVAEPEHVQDVSPWRKVRAQPSK